MSEEQEMAQSLREDFAKEAEAHLDFLMHFGPWT